MIPFSPIVENRSVPMPAERFFIKQARRKPGGPVFYDHKNNTNLHRVYVSCICLQRPLRPFGPAPLKGGGLGAGEFYSATISPTPFRIYVGR